MGPDGVKIPDQQARTGIGTKTVSELIGENFKLSVDGKNVTATGDVNNIAEPWTDFDKSGNNTGHFVPLMFPAELKGQKVVLSGLSSKDRTITVDTDLMHVQRLENLSDEQRLTVKKNGDLVMSVDFSGVTKNP